MSRRPEAPVPSAGRDNPHALVSRAAMDNALLNLQECRERREVLASQPLKLYLEPTDRCHLRCTYCYPPDDKPQQLMSMELFHRVEEQLFDRCLEVNLFLSGEPALAPDLSAMIDTCTRYPFITKTFSSLSYRDDALLRRIVERGVWLNVSFDGIEATRAMRKGSRLDLILENIDKLAAYRRAGKDPRHHLRMAAVVGKHNAPELPALVSWAQAKGFDEIMFGCLDSAPGTTKLALDAQDLRHFRQAVARADDVGMRISCPSHIGGRPLERAHNWDDTRLDIDRYFPHFVELCNPDVERSFCPYP